MYEEERQWRKQLTFYKRIIIIIIESASEKKYMFKIYGCPNYRKLLNFG